MGTATIERVQTHDGQATKTPVGLPSSAGPLPATSLGIVPCLLWLLLAGIGQAASLGLIAAGPTVRYQHFRMAELLDGTSLALLAIVGVQAVAVGIGLMKVWPRLRQWIVQNYRPWQLAVLVLVFGLTSATLSRQPMPYVAELLFATLIQFVSLANVVLAIAALNDSAILAIKTRIDRLLNGVQGSRIDWFGIVVAGCAVVSAAALSYWPYQWHPHVPDEVVYLHHARYFAAGLLGLPVPPVPEGFDVDLMHQAGDRWLCPVPPGWPAILAIGVFFGNPWLVNPILTGVNVLLAGALVRRLYDPATARLTMLLLCVSPWSLFLGMSLMTHAATLTFALAAALALARARDSGQVGWALLSGGAVGAVSLIRPLEGLVLAALMGIWVMMPHGRCNRKLAFTLLTLGAMLVGALVLPYNAALMGDPFKMPMQDYTDRTYGPGTNSLGFGPDRGLGWSGLDPLPGHGALDVLINANLNLFATNVELFGWATGSLLVVAVALISGLTRADRMMVAVIVLIVGIHSFYYFSGGPDFGARYWYLVILPCIVLAVRGAQSIGARLGKHGYVKVVAGMACLTLLSLVTFVPWRAVDKYHHYRGMRPDVRDLASTSQFGRSLILIRGHRHPDYASAATYNPLDLFADAPIYAWDRDEKVRGRLLETYPDRPVWIVNGPTVSGRGFEVVDGPIQPQERQARGLGDPVSKNLSVGREGSSS